MAVAFFPGMSVDKKIANFIFLQPLGKLAIWESCANVVRFALDVLFSNKHFALVAASIFSLSVDDDSVDAI